MTPTVPAAGLAPAPPAAPDMVPQASQNLFEHIAANARGLPEGANPSQLGQDIMQHLQGFFERSSSFAERAGKLVQGAPEASRSGQFASLGSQPVANADPGKPGVDGQQMSRVVESLSMMFDHSIETQMVVRGATQVSGAANTLLRGQ